LIKGEKISANGMQGNEYLFPNKSSATPHLSTRQYARGLYTWVESIGLDSSAYGTHSVRRTKALLIYRRTKNPLDSIRAVQLLHGYTNLGSTVRYLGIEVDDALEMAEQTEI
jgi:site-specific recombinase XerD